MIKKMNSKYANIFISLVIVFAGGLASLAIVQAQSQNGNDIVFPVEELGSCQNETECKTFCDKKENISACVDFAEKHNLMSKEEVKKAKAFAEIGSGPGGCQSKDECEAYCEDQNNMDACLAFAEENNFMDENELKEAKQVAQALKEGASLPGGCQNKKKCEAYCDDSEHMDECLSFAEKAGFMGGGELEDAKKAVKAMKSGVKPPGNCKGKEQCDTYCSESSHMEECLNFAEKAGFMPKEEVDMARKIMPMMMKGEMPGGCKSKEQCENYCENSEHSEECANFAVKAGFVNQDENEASKENNFIPKEKLKEMQEGMDKMMKGEGQEMMGEKIKNEMMGKIRKEMKEKMMETGDMPPADGVENYSPTKEELEAEGELSSEKTQDKTAQ